MNIVARLASVLANAENIGVEVSDVLEDAKTAIENLEREVDDLRSFLNGVATNCAERAKNNPRR